MFSGCLSVCPSVRCHSVYCPLGVSLSVNPFSMTRFLFITGGIRMKLSTHIYHMSGVADEVVKVRGQKVKVIARPNALFRPRITIDLRPSVR